MAMAREKPGGNGFHPPAEIGLRILFLRGPFSQNNTVNIEVIFPLPLGPFVQSNTDDRGQLLVKFYTNNSFLHL